MIAKSVRVLCAVGMGLAVLGTAHSGPADFVARPEVGVFVDEMAEKHGFEPRGLTALLESAQMQEKILSAISKPAESKPWHEYRPIFLTPSRIEGGVDFWNQHQELLGQAEARYGVPPEIIVSIIGVETRYGRHTGSYRVLDALATLAFAYPKRSRFFRSELEHYLLLTREEAFDPLTPKGSYAGAMGQPQFISSSYRHYAVDFDDDGIRDLWNNSADIIGSVANYFAQHGWQTGQPIAAPAEVSGDRFRSLLTKSSKPKLSLKVLREKGVQVKQSWPDDQVAALIELEGPTQSEFWVGLHNFYVITRYNHSNLYAMAVYQLSQEILNQRDRQNAGGFAQRGPSVEFADGSN